MSIQIIFHFFPSHSTYQLIFEQTMLEPALVCHLTIQHQSNHLVAPHCPTLTDNPQHIKLVLLLILQHCKFFFQLISIICQNNQILKSIWMCVCVYVCQCEMYERFRKIKILLLLWWIIRKSSHENATTSFTRYV